MNFTGKSKGLVFVYWVSKKCQFTTMYKIKSSNHSYKKGVVIGKKKKKKVKKERKEKNRKRKKINK